MGNNVSVSLPDDMDQYETAADALCSPTTKDVARKTAESSLVALAANGFTLAYPTLASFYFKKGFFQPAFDYYEKHFAMAILPRDFSIEAESVRSQYQQTSLEYADAARHLGQFEIAIKYYTLAFEAGSKTAAAAGMVQVADKILFSYGVSHVVCDTTEADLHVYHGDFPEVLRGRDFSCLFNIAIHAFENPMIYAPYLKLAEQLGEFISNYLRSSVNDSLDITALNFDDGQLKIVLRGYLLMANIFETKDGLWDEIKPVVEGVFCLNRFAIPKEIFDLAERVRRQLAPAVNLKTYATEFWKKPPADANAKAASALVP